MLKYLQKFAMDILPSVAATIIGAYIVNHYIVPKSADAPTATVSSATPKTDNPKTDNPKNVPTVVAAKPADASIDTANNLQPGVTAKGVSEQALIEKTAAERPAEVKPAETASLPADSRRRPAPPAHEKAVARVTPTQPAAPVTPAATPSPAETTAAAPSDEHRDANELAREAIERLRANSDAASRAPEAPRVPEAPREALREAPRVPPSAVASAPPIVRPLPPPVILATPPADKPDMAGSPPYTASVPVDDPNRPIPPADIPPARPRPLADLRAQAANAASHATDVAQDMLSAAKSMFHAVLPGSGQNGGRQFSDDGHFRSD